MITARVKQVQPAVSGGYDRGELKVDGAKQLSGRIIQVKSQGKRAALGRGKALAAVQPYANREGRPAGHNVGVRYVQRRAHAVEEHDNFLLGIAQSNGHLLGKILGSKEDFLDEITQAGMRAHFTIDACG